jgi:hypothetical protein
MEEWRCIYIILNVSNRLRRAVGLLTRRLYPWGKSPRYTLDRRLGGPQNWPGHCREGSLVPSENRTPIPRPSIHSLYRLSHHRSKILWHGNPFLGHATHFEAPAGKQDIRADAMTSHNSIGMSPVMRLLRVSASDVTHTPHLARCCATDR